MNTLPSTSFAIRLNAFAAAAAVTLAMLAGIDSMAVAQTAALPIAQATAAPAV
jgi:hypothetical protein